MDGTGDPFSDQLAAVIGLQGATIDLLEVGLEVKGEAWRQHVKDALEQLRGQQMACEQLLGTRRQQRQHPSGLPTTVAAGRPVETA